MSGFAWLKPTLPDVATPGYLPGMAAISREFEKDGLTYLYRVSPTPQKGHIYAELRILREEKALGETIFAQPQLIWYKGLGTLDLIDSGGATRIRGHLEVDADLLLDAALPVPDPDNGIDLELAQENFVHAYAPAGTGTSSSSGHRGRATIRGTPLDASP